MVGGGATRLLWGVANDVVSNWEAHTGCYQWGQSHQHTHNPCVVVPTHVHTCIHLCTHTHTHSHVTHNYRPHLAHQKDLLALCPALTLYMYTFISFIIFYASDILKPQKLQCRSITHKPLFFYIHRTCSHCHSHSSIKFMFLAVTVVCITILFWSNFYSCQLNSKNTFLVQQIPVLVIQYLINYIYIYMATCQCCIHF